MYNFQTSYARDPWDNIDTNERPWYDPILREVYVRKAIYSPFAAMKVDLAAQSARTITFSDLIPPVPNTSPIGARQLEASRLYMDSYQRTVTVERYGNGMSLFREDELFNFWKRSGDAGLVAIINQALGQVVVDQMDLLARNAFLTAPYSTFGRGTASGFEGITASDKISTELLDGIALGLADRTHLMPQNALPNPYELDGSEMICLTTRGVIYDLKREIDPNGPSFVESSKYQGGTNLMTGEVGMYRGFRFVDSPLATLWNAGKIITQTAIKAAVEPGDGAPDPQITKVASTRSVGQRAAKHYIDVADASGFSVGDMVTVHKTRTTGANPFGAVNGVDFKDESAQVLQIVAIDTAATPDRIVFNKPYMYSEGLTVDLGSTTFGYVTKARSIHTALFLNPTQPGIICGVTQPPVIYTPPAVDDFLSVYRITYDMWLKFQLWNPEAYEVGFFAGSTRTNAPRQV